MDRLLRRLLLVVVLLLAATVFAGLAYEQWSRRAAARDFPPVGRLVEHDGKLSHLHCTGEGSPTVILEAGRSVGGSQDWTEVQPGIAEVTRVCSYDRAGILWSEPREEPRDAHRIVDELHGLLQAAGERPPWVMVGHSLGGLLIRVYDQRHPGEAAGFVLVDASHPEQFERYGQEVRAALSEAQPPTPSPLFARLWAASGGYRLGLPARRDAVGAFLPRSVPWGFLGEGAARDAIYQQAAATDTLGDRPLVVLTAGVAPSFPGMSEALRAEFYETWLELQSEFVELSSDSEQRVVEGATHNIHVDAPEAVVAAVRELVEAVRRGRS